MSGPEPAVATTGTETVQTTLVLEILSVAELLDSKRSDDTRNHGEGKRVRHCSQLS